MPSGESTKRAETRRVLQVIDQFCSALMPGDKVPPHTELMRTWETLGNPYGCVLFGCGLAALGQQLRGGGARVVLVGTPVPEEISAVGYDALPEGEQAHPALTTIEPFLGEFLQTAVDLLNQSKPPPASYTAQSFPR